MKVEAHGSLRERGQKQARSERGFQMLPLGRLLQANAIDESAGVDEPSTLRVQLG
jgi:hypothetical protein